MIVAIHQPQFLPWLGYLHKIAACDAFIFLDNVQFKKNEFQNRNKLLVSYEPKWITVPVSFKFGDTLHQVRVPDATGWRETMWKTIEHNYQRAPYFEAYAFSFRELIMQPWNSLADFNEATVRWLLQVFGIATPLHTASHMPDAVNDPTGRLVELCKMLAATAYLSGTGGHDYLDEALFKKAQLKLLFQTFKHPVYRQTIGRRPGQAFASHLSAFDGLMNCGGGADGCRALGLNTMEHGA